MASQVLGGTEDEAEDWLQTFMKVPSRKDASAMKQTRRSKPVLRVKPHIMYVLKEQVALVFFGTLRVRRDMISSIEAQTLLDNMGYACR